ncbi:MAG: hypothetical protein AAB212_10050, partial [Bacteroidota bacterium]
LIQQHKPVLYFEYNKSNIDAIKEDGLSTLLSLEKCGYRKVLFFDNRGRYMLTAHITNHTLIKELHYYADESNSEIVYYDICLFHEEDEDLATIFLLGEKHF